MGKEKKGKCGKGDWDGKSAVLPVERPRSFWILTGLLWSELSTGPVIRDGSSSGWERLGPC